MSSSSSDAIVERRRQQNRDAQRKRRNALKAQIVELQARNLELQAFKESTLSSTTNQPTLRGPGNHLTPDVSCLLGGSFDTSYHVSSEDQGPDIAAMSMALRPDFPKLDDAFIREISESLHPNTRIVSRSQMGSILRHYHEAEDTTIHKAPPTPTSDSGPGTYGTPLPTTYTDATMSPSSGKQDFGLQLGDTPLNDSLDLSICPQASELSPRTGAVETVGRQVGSRTPRPCFRDKKQSAMAMAVANRQAAVVRLLLQHGVDMNARDDRGRTALHDTAETNDTEMMQLLLDYNADLNIVDESGMVPIEIAASLGNIEAVEVLLRANP
ncbi:hypothetical protein MferCBS31731_002579 [Microsporum ferrugineum]